MINVKYDINKKSEHDHTLDAVIKNIKNHTNFKYKLNFYYVNWNDMLWVILLPYFLLLLLSTIWSSPSLSLWFGHMYISPYSYKIMPVIIFIYLLIITSLLTISYFSSKEIYDYFLTLFNFLYWIIFLFLSNSIFTMIFIIEVLSTLIFLLIITSVYSTSFFYKTTNMSYGHLFQQNTPFNYLQSLLFFFW
jgi:hypothetical protein